MAGVKGRSGRKRTPKAKLLSRGSKYAERQNDFNLQDGLYIPDNDKKWFKHQENFWKIYGSALIQAGIVRTTDSPAFDALSESFCLWKTCSDALKDGDIMEKLLDTIKSKRGTYKTMSELSKMAKIYRDDFMKMCREFGMTPSSRGSLDLSNSSSDDMFDDDGETLT